MKLKFVFIKLSYALASFSICMYRCTPSTSSLSIPWTIASANVSTLTVLSTKGIPTALAMLNTGITGKTSNCERVGEVID